VKKRKKLFFVNKNKNKMSLHNVLKMESQYIGSKILKALIYLKRLRQN